jgi:mRNA-degrading endonuclease RelE of RelBE toxin-antitoxin system
MRRKILWHHDAVEQIVQLAARNARQATRIMLVLRDFANTSKGDLKKLAGSDEWRLRSGDWRIFLKLDGAEVWVLGISDRQDAY